MAFVAHVAFHLTMCSSINKLPANAPIDITVHAMDHSGRQRINQEFHIVRGTSLVHTIEYDSPFGVYKVTVSAPKYNCNAGDYFMFLADHNRSIDMTLAEGPPQYGEPMLLEGTAPQSFADANPTFVLLDKSIACDKPIGDPIPAKIRLESDPDSYYVWLYSTPEIVARGGAQIALQLATPTGEYHYLRLKYPFPQPWDGWPTSLQLNIADGMFDELAEKPTDTLICLKMIRSSAG